MVNQSILLERKRRFAFCVDSPTQLNTNPFQKRLLQDLTNKNIVMSIKGQKHFLRSQLSNF